MTLLVVAIQGQDGLVLASDSRGTFGDPNSVTAQNDSQQKAHILSEHVAVTTSGNGEVAALLVHERRLPSRKQRWTGLLRSWSS